MVLFAIVGELGAGKTLTLAYLSWNNWFNKGRRVYSNFDFFGFPFTKISTMPDLDQMKAGFFAGDELWLWVDSWASKETKTRVISSILLKSRKRDITIAYTSQSFHQITKRIRDVTDFIAYPMMSPDETTCKVVIFRGGEKPSPINQPPIYFNCEPVYAMYNTYEEIKPIDPEKVTFKEAFMHIKDNPAWQRYMQKKGASFQRMVKYSGDIQRAVNPDNIQQESQRKKPKEEMLPF